MKITSSLFVAAFLLSMTLLSANAQEEIHWAKSVKQAQLLAKQQNKPVLLHFWATWCGPCKKLDVNVFPEQDVVRAVNENFIAVKVDLDKSGSLPRQFGIKSIPHDVFLTPDGNIITQGGTPQLARQYSSLLRQVAAHSAATVNTASGPPRQSDSTRTASNTVPIVTSQEAANLDPRDRFSNSSQTFALSDTPPADSLSQGARISNPNFNPQRPSLSKSSFQSVKQPLSGAGREGEFQTPQSTSPESIANRKVIPSQFAGNRSSSATTAPAAATAKAQAKPAAATLGLAAARPRTSVAPTAKAEHPPLGLEGFCPVTLTQEKSWRRGNKQHGVIHRGRLYLFVTSVAKDQFRANPDQYSPALSGLDPVLYADQRTEAYGTREHGVFFQDQIYLFTSEETLQHFWSNREKYSDVVRQAMAQADAKTKRR